jgi:phosphoribosylanthranilate isomerase
VHERAEGKVRGRAATLLLDGEAVARLLDLPWQEEDSGHWERAAAIAREERVLLAGRLGPENVADAIATVRPWAVDASSSLETSPGVKDHARIKAYVDAARA